MKKFFFVFLFSCLITSLCSAKEIESYFNLSYSHGFFNEIGEESKTDIDSNGFNLGIMTFSKDKNIGIYMNTEYQFIDKMSVSVEGISLGLGNNYFDNAMILQLLTGAAFRLPVNDNLLFVGGIGVSLTEFAFTFNILGSKAGFVNLSLGLGGEAGVKYSINEKFSIQTGVTANFDFINLLCISNGSEQENTAKYPGFSPYIGFSLKIGEIIK